MRPGMQTLLALMRDELKGVDLDSEEWNRLLDLAEEENVLPWVASCIRSQTDHRAPEIDARLCAIERDAQVSAFIWSATLRSTLAEFHRQAIAVIPLKGPWLGQRIYGNSALRLYSDLDLLVKRRDFARSEELLCGLGFVAEARRDDYARTFCRGGITIELHDDLENPLAVDFGIEHAWHRAQAAEFDGVPALLLAPHDELRFLCLHGARHRFERLSHILDLALAFPRLTEAQPVRYRESDRMLALGCMMATHLNPEFRRFQALYEAIPDCISLEHTAGMLWQERLREPAPALTWLGKHLFLLSVERPGWDRIRSLLRYIRILSTRLIAEDFAFAGRFRLQRNWQVWMLRPVRLLLNARRMLPDSS